MKLVVIFLILGIVYVESADINRLKTRPRGMDTFDLRKFMGKWYLYASTMPCSWQGAYTFKDWIYNYNLDPNSQSATIEDSWRKDGKCTFTTEKTTLTGTGSLKIVDRMGDVCSGHKIIMYTDYYNYVIAWGCVKESVHNGICDDYWFSVKTRYPKLSQKYVDEINKKLYQFWGKSLSDMRVVPQSNPCDRADHGPSRMFKTY